MAMNTIELRHLLEIPGFNLFDFNYPCPDQEFKTQLEKDIKDYYFFEEIGQESVDRMKQRLMNKMNMIMPYWNKVYASTKLEFNPLVNYKMTEIMDQTIVDITDSAGSSTSNNDIKNSDHPQHALLVGDILTEQTVTEGASGTTATVEGNNNLDYTKTVEGISGKTYGQLIAEYRGAILRINSMIIKELKPIFHLVY